MKKKLLFVSLLMIIFFVSGTSAFAKVEVELPSKLVALFNVLRSIEASRPGDITVNLYGQTLTVIDFSYFEHHRDTIFWLIRAAVYPFLLLFIYDNIMIMLRGMRYTSYGFYKGMEHFGDFMENEFKNKW